MNLPEQPLVARAGGPGCRHREPPAARVLSNDDNGCFVDGCALAVEWVGWWYCEDGARHLTESCCEHSDHHDFTPVSRLADPLAATSDRHGHSVE